MQTSATNQPQSDVGLAERKLGKHWSALSQALYNTYDQSFSAREGLDRNLTIANNFYEMRTAPRNWPWKNASNVTTTIIPTQVDTMLANVVLAVYAIQRFYVVNGNTPQAADNQHSVEAFMNAELFRPRPGKTWLMQHVESLFASLRDGNGITAISYRKEYAKQRVAIVERLKDEASGMDLLHPETNKPIMRTRIEEQVVPIYDDVDLETVELRDFGVIPAWQTDVDKAAACWRRKWLDSTQLRAMCKSEANPDGPLQKDAVEYAISMVAPGSSEIALQRQGYSTYSIAGQIEVYDTEEGAAAPELKQHVGPLEVIQIHSRQFFDGEEYVFWLHPHSQTCLGYQKYQYWHGQRPYSIKVPIPRVNRFYGFGVPERLIPGVVEIQGNRNRRNDFLDQRTLPPQYIMDGVKLLTKNNSWGPDARYSVPAGMKDGVGFIPMPEGLDTLMAGKEEEMLMRQDIEEYTGNSAPMLGSPGSGRPTAKGIQASIAKASVRHNFIAMNVRDSDTRTLYQIVQLKIQYGPDVSEVDTNVGGQPRRLIVPKDILAMDYTWSVAGSGGPLDKATRAQEMQSLYALLMNNPLVQGDPVKIWGVTRMLLEEYNRADILALIGTRDEVEQQKKAAEMMQKLGIGAPQPGGKQQAPPQPGGQ